MTHSKIGWLCSECGSIQLFGSNKPTQPATQKPQATTPNAGSPQNLGIVINDVNASLWQYIRKRYWWELLILIPLIVAWEYLLFRYVGPTLFQPGSDNPNSGKGFGEMVLLPIILLSAWYWRLKKRFEDTFLREFSADNGYSYDAKGTVDETYGTLFRLNGTQRVSDVISGQYQGYDLRLFLYDRTVNSGRSSSTYRYTVLELDLKGRVPAMLLAPKHALSKNLGLAQATGLHHTISLEGDFDQRFTLYALQGTEVEALEVFAPNVMALMEDESKDYTIEFVANRVYIYARSYIGNNQALEQLFGLAKALIDKIGPVAARLNHDAAIPQAPVNLRTARANSLSKRSFMIIFAITILAITVGVIVGVVGRQHNQPSPTVTSASNVNDTNPDYLSAIAKARTDDQNSSDSNNLGTAITDDGLRALEAAQTNVQTSEAEYWVGLGYFWQKSYDTALSYEQQAVTHDPTNSSALAATGNLLVNTGQYQAAITTANRELGVNAQDSSAYRVLAFAYANLGQKDQALQEIAKATQLDQAAKDQQDISADSQDQSIIQTAAAGTLRFSPN